MLSPKLNDQKDALAWARLFGLLQKASVQTSQPTVKSHWKEYNSTAPSDWTVDLRERTDGWTVSLTFLTDPHIVFCQRFTFGISKQGLIKVMDRRTVFMKTNYI